MTTIMALHNVSGNCPYCYGVHHGKSNISRAHAEADLRHEISDCGDRLKRAEQVNAKVRA